MKKYLVILIGIILIIVCRVIFNGNNNEKIEINSFNCNLNSETGNYKIESIYNVQYKGNIVTEVHFYEEISSDEKDTINDIYEEKSKEYKKLNNLYGGVLYNFGKSSNNLTVEVKINYEDFNMNELINNNLDLKKYVNKKNQLTVDGIKKYYSSLGIICE